MVDIVQGEVEEEDDFVHGGVEEEDDVFQGEVVEEHFLQEEVVEDDVVVDGTVVGCFLLVSRSCVVGVSRDHHLDFRYLNGRIVVASGVPDLCAAERGQFFDRIPVIYFYDPRGPHWIWIRLVYALSLEKSVWHDPIRVS